MSGVMMAAGIDATGNLDLEFADVVLTVEIGEAFGDLLRHRNGTRVRQIAVIQPRAADDVGDQPGVRRGEA